MATFLYKAKKGPDEIVEASIEADSEASAARQLMQSGCYPIWIKAKHALSEEKIKGVSFFSKKVKAKDLAVFTRQLSELLDSGIALYDSLSIIENQIDSPQLKEIINGVRNRVRDGSTFSESLENYPRVFSNLYINLIRSGETGGMLDEVLENIADFLETQDDTRSRIVASMAYPALMMAVGIITIFILMTFVIPKLADMFVDMGEVLPLSTRILIGLSDFVRMYWILLALFVGGAAFLYKKSKSNILVKKTIDGFKLRLPIFGTLLKDDEFARFSRTLSTLLKNGVPMLDALKTASDIVDNEVVKTDALGIYDDVKAGSSLAASMKKSSCFPQFMANMVKIGEEGGILDKTLSKVAKSYENEAGRMTKTLSSLLEPAVILIMGAIVGFIVIAMLLPVFQISLTTH